MTKKKTKKHGHLKLVSNVRADQQVSEALAQLLAADLDWDEADKYLDTLQRNLSRALPQIEELLRRADLEPITGVARVLNYLEGPTVEAMLLRCLHDTSLSDDVRMALLGLSVERGLEVDAESVIGSLRDAAGAFRRSLDQLLVQVAASRSFRQSLLEDVQTWDAEPLDSWLALLLESKDPRILYVLLPLLYGSDEKRTLQIVKTLDQLGHPAAAPALAELAAAHISSRVRKAARAAQGRLTMRGSVQPAEAGLPFTPLPPLARAYLTTLDGDGGQGVGVVRRQTDGRLTIASIAINDHQGVRNCVGAEGVDPDEWDMVMADMTNGGIAPVDMPLSICRRTLEDARRLTLQRGLPLPPEAEVWREAFQGEDLPDVAEPAAPVLTPAEARELLETTDSLADWEYFHSWFFNPDEMEPFLDEAERLEPNRWDEPWDRLVEKVLRRLVNEERREQLRVRLERQAALLAGLDEDEAARLAAAAAWGLRQDSGVKPHQHPFLMEMVETSFDNMWGARDEEEEWDEEEEEWDEEWDEESEDELPSAWPDNLPQTEAEWRAFIAVAQSPMQVLNAWFHQRPPANLDEVNEVTNYIMNLWNATPRPDLGGRSPAQAAGIPTPKVPPMPKLATAAPPPPPPRPTRLDDVLNQVRSYYKSLEWTPPLAEKQVLGYLQDAQRQGASLDDLDARWRDLEFFHFFLDHYGSEISALDDLQPYHLSEWMTDFVERKVLGGMTLEDKRRALQTARALYAYLAREGDVTPETAQAVEQAVAQITKPRRGLARIERPLPLGGETMMTVASSRGEFVYTLNDVWLTQVCDRDFQRNWGRMRQAAQKVPGAALKLRLIDRLQQTQQDGEDPFGLLYSYPPDPQALDVARHMFRQQEMTEDRAW